jgi:hypothetical protein
MRNAKRESKRPLFDAAESFRQQLKKKSPLPESGAREMGLRGAKSWLGFGFAVIAIAGFWFLRRPESQEWLNQIKENFKNVA